MDFIADDREAITMVAAGLTRYLAVYVCWFLFLFFGPPDLDSRWKTRGGGVAAGFLDADELGKPECSEIFHLTRPGLVLWSCRRGEGVVGENPERIFKIPWGGGGLALFAFFNTTIQCRMAISRFCFLQKVERACYSFSANGSCVCVWLC